MFPPTALGPSGAPTLPLWRSGEPERRGPIRPFLRAPKPLRVAVSPKRPPLIIRRCARRLIQGKQMTTSKQATLLLAALLSAPLALLAAYVLLQRSFIYYPSKYPRGAIQRALSQGVMLIGLQMSRGKQAAFWYALSPSDAPPRRLWLMFGGNAMSALDWLDLPRGFPDRCTSFLLVDYPGYGLCEGSPNPARIRESAERAFQALQAQTHGRFLRQGRSAWSAGR
jgi:hypothetical protein